MKALNNKVSRQILSMLDYMNLCEKRFRLFNTLRLYPFTVPKNLEWVKKTAERGYGSACKRACRHVVCNEIERNKLFRGTAKAEDRSYMNICFVMNDEYKSTGSRFLLQFATERGMVGIKGHRSVGFRKLMLQRTNDRGRAGIDKA